MAHPGGRPSKYNEKLLKKANGYIDRYEELGDLIPSVTGLACYLGVNTTTLQAWARSGDKEEFSSTLERIKDRQCRVTLNGGLTGKFNAGIAKLILYNHGFSERREQTLQGRNGGPVQTESKVISAGMSAEEATELYQRMLNDDNQE